MGCDVGPSSDASTECPPIWSNQSVGFVSSRQMSRENRTVPQDKMPKRNSAMNRWLWIGSLAGLLLVSTGCLHNQTRSGCSTGTCSTGACSTGTCNSGACGGTGLLGKMNVGCNTCGNGCGNGCRTGCVAGKLGWQQGGHDYSSHLNPGMLGHRASTAINSQPFTPGPPTGQVAYPYYTVRGPRDFLLNDPPTIGR